MTTASSGAVFFLGTRAHYQVLQQPESRFGAENGNSTESIYQNPSVDSPDSSYTRDIGERNLAYIDSEANEDNHKETTSVIKRRASRRPSEQILCDDRDSDMKPALLNHLGESETPKKPSRRRINLLTFLASLVRRKRHLDAGSIQYLQHIETALTSCTYRESCRCLHCQSRYFDCDESEYSSDESEYNYEYQYGDFTPPQVQDTQGNEEDNDEVFIDSAPGDNASTDLLLDSKPAPVREISVSSEDEAREDVMDLEVAAGTPVLLNYLLTHPITCSIQ